VEVSGLGLRKKGIWETMEKACEGENSKKHALGNLWEPLRESWATGRDEGGASLIIKVRVCPNTVKRGGGHHI